MNNNRNSSKPTQTWDLTGGKDTITSSSGAQFGATLGPGHSGLRASLHMTWQHHGRHFHSCDCCNVVFDRWWDWKSRKLIYHKWPCTVCLLYKTKNQYLVGWPRWPCAPLRHHWQQYTQNNLHLHWMVTKEPGTQKTVTWTKQHNQLLKEQLAPK